MAVVLLLAGCASAPEQPDLQSIYREVARASEPGEHPLITVPGLLGSRLVEPESGAVVWGGGARTGLSADPEDPADMRRIALPVVPRKAPFADISDDVVARGVLERAEAEVLGVPFVVDVYGGVLDLLAAGGFRSTPEPSPDAPVYGPGGAPNFAAYRRVASDAANDFRFAYDWRRDISSLARAFHRFVQQRKRRVAAIRSLYDGRSVRPEEVRFDLLAHSMGGLVARYYLMHGTAPLGEEGALPPLTWAGAEHFRRAVFVAPPNAGSILAVDNLVNGKRFAPLQPKFPAALLATHPSVWQLFPRERHRRLAEEGGEPLDPLDPAVWERFGWGLLDAEGADVRAALMPELPDDAARRARARAHQARLMRRARRFQRAMDRWGTPPAHLETFLVVGGGFRTPAAAEVTPETGALAIAAEEEGDGVVLRASALLDERQGGEGAGRLRTPLRFDTTLFLPDEHVEITRNPVFGDNLLFWLLEQPRDAAMLAEPDRPPPAAARGRGDGAFTPAGAPDR